MGVNVTQLAEQEASYTCVEELKKLVADVNIPVSLKGFDIGEDALDSLADDGIKQTRILARSPMPLEREDIYAIYHAAYSGEVAEKKTV